MLRVRYMGGDWDRWSGFKRHQDHVFASRIRYFHMFTSSKAILTVELARLPWVKHSTYREHLFTRPKQWWLHLRSFNVKWFVKLPTGDALWHDGNSIDIYNAAVTSGSILQYSFPPFSYEDIMSYRFLLMTLSTIRIVFYLSIPLTSRL